MKIVGLADATDLNDAVNSNTANTIYLEKKCR